MPTVNDLCAMLGVEIDEKFLLKTRHGDILEPKFIINKNGYIFGDSGISYPVPDLFNGTFEIVKKPWKPKEGDKYWSVGMLGVYSENWSNHQDDLCRYYSGNCFRSLEEAKRNGGKVMKKIKAYYENGGNANE